jgi:hypothetical protein
MICWPCRRHDHAQEPDQIGGSRSLPDHPSSLCATTWRWFSAYVFLARGGKGLINGPGSDEIPEPPDLTGQASGASPGAGIARAAAPAPIRKQRLEQAQRPQLRPRAHQCSPRRRCSRALISHPKAERRLCYLRLWVRVSVTGWL